MQELAIVASWEGRCPICLRDTRFTARESWFRDHLICETCEGGSVPRERALMLVIRQLVSDWESCAIHESSPGGRGVSTLMFRKARNYLPTNFYLDIPLGTVAPSGIRCENLERQTFPDESFDLVITQDVMEHVFDPASAHREIYRTLRPGGRHIHTTPIYKEIVESVCRASIGPDGKITYLMEPEYHGNPISPDGSLVTFSYGYDIAELIAGWTQFDVEIRRFRDRTRGIVAEFTEVIVCTKPILAPT
jgi:SAM-dependent methyltransferase